jgi:hypothetical protein
LFYVHWSPLRRGVFISYWYKITIVTGFIPHLWKCGVVRGSHRSGGVYPLHGKGGCLFPIGLTLYPTVPGSTQRCICIMDPLKGPSLLISSCSSLHRPICAPNTSSYIIRGKGKAYLFIAQIGRYIYRMWRWERCFLCPCWNLYSQHMSTLCTLWSLWFYPRRLQYNGECTLCTVYSSYLSPPWTAPLEKQRRFCALS